MLSYKILDGKTVLVTGGTGSFGTNFVSFALKSKLKKLIVLSRDEFKQFEMKNRFADDRLRFFLGDVRDLERLRRAFMGVDIVIHAAALKQVPALEYNPIEAIHTNILGTQNVITAALDNCVQKALFISTDKAVSPVNLYGATKLCAEKLWVAANAYRDSRTKKPAFSVVRYGNVIGSRGSIVEVLKKQGKDQTLYLTHEQMTRFWLTLKDAVGLVLHTLSHMKGGEIFVPKVPSMKVKDLIETLAEGREIKVIGIRPGEKLHEELLSQNEIKNTRDMEHCFVIEPSHAPWWVGSHLKKYRQVPHTFSYTSDANTLWLSRKDFSNLLKEVF